MEKIEIGSEVIRIKGGYTSYVVGRVGVVDCIENGKALVSWYNSNKSIVSLSSIALTSIPYELTSSIVKGYTVVKYNLL